MSKNPERKRLLLSNPLLLFLMIKMMTKKMMKTYPLVKNVRRMYNKAKFKNQRRWQEKDENKIVCYNCRKSGHVIVITRYKDQTLYLQEALQKGLEGNMGFRERL